MSRSAAFAEGAWGSGYAVGASLNRAMALGLVGLGFIVAHRAGLTNVGGEGQIAVGGMAATAMCLYGGAAHLPGPLAWMVPMAVAALAGGLWGGIAGVLKVRVGTNEVISTLLLSFIGVWLLYGSVQSVRLLRQPMTNSATLPESLDIPDATHIPLLSGDASVSLHAGLPIAIVLAVVVAVLLQKTRFGLELRAVGLNPVAARRAGMPIAASIVLAMFLAGAFGGLAGAFMLQGEQFVLKARFSSGYGFDGLVVGLLARGSVQGRGRECPAVRLAALGRHQHGAAGRGAQRDRPDHSGADHPGGGRCGLLAPTRRSEALSWHPLRSHCSACFLGSTIRLAMPMMLGAIGELVSERAGVLNLSVEGMMLFGAFAGAMGSLASGSPSIGIAVAVIAVIPLALLQAWLSNTLRANQIVSGIGINVLVLGATTIGYRALLGSRSRVQIPGLDKWSPPGLADLPIVGPAIFQQNPLVYLAFAIVAVVAFVMRYTALGLSIHAAGTEPRALDKSGGSVLRVRYGAVVFTGMMSALGGAFLSLGDIHTFTEGMTSGAGYLALVGVIFGNWKVGRTVLACLFFGAATALQFQLPAMGLEVPNFLLIMLPYVMALLAVAGLVGRQSPPAALTLPYLR